ncbi:hypothetical protein AA309_20850 [Microvirga vignae]|uniref:Uncharacterized protein n=1 Tax=Microvirga vignae TaxID=1225564 RepID=A0A0H1R923_9HYPH|nr:hypothetical protein [Microvirga vignae]KLK91311.1 hypothetical protein AA309_20850 [Microvirga vignae]
MSEQDIKFEKTIDAEIDSEVALDWDIEFDKDVEADVKVDSDVDLDGNSTMVTVDAEAYGDNSLVEVDTAVLTTDKLSHASVAVISAVSEEAKPLLIDFEGIAPEGGTAEIQDGYKGLNWDNFWAQDDSQFAASGYNNVINSPDSAGYDAFANGASFSSPDPDEDFDLVSGYFAAAWNNDLVVTIQGFDDGVLVGTKVVTLDPTKTFIEFGDEFESIDEVRIDGAGGTNAGLDGAGEHVAMDDLLLRVPVDFA